MLFCVLACGFTDTSVEWVIGVGGYCRFIDGVSAVSLGDFGDSTLFVVDVVGCGIAVDLLCDVATGIVCVVFCLLSCALLTSALLNQLLGLLVVIVDCLVVVALGLAVAYAVLGVPCL